jgi:large subunit ribosomal protein L21
MYAIVECGGKQYRVAPGEKIRVESLAVEPESDVILDKVLLVGTDEDVSVGAPYLAGATVRAKVLAHGKENKVIIFKYRRKKNYRRFRGHRQPYTQLRIEEIRA